MHRLFHRHVSKAVAGTALLCLVTLVAWRAEAHTPLLPLWPLEDSAHDALAEAAARLLSNELQEPAKATAPQPYLWEVFGWQSPKNVDPSPLQVWMERNDGMNAGLASHRPRSSQHPTFPFAYDEEQRLANTYGGPPDAPHHTGSHEAHDPNFPSYFPQSTWYSFPPTQLSMSQGWALTDRVENPYMDRPQQTLQAGRLVWDPSLGSWILIPQNIAFVCYSYTLHRPPLANNIQQDLIGLVRWLFNNPSLQHPNILPNSYHQLPLFALSEDTMWEFKREELLEGYVRPASRCLRTIIAHYYKETIRYYTKQVRPFVFLRDEDLNAMNRLQMIAFIFAHSMEDIICIPNFWRTLAPSVRDYLSELVVE